MGWRNTRDYRVWRAQVIRRDGVCQACGSSVRRVAHHINSGSYFPYIRYDLDNGVCLCKDCHKAIHCDFKPSYRAKVTHNDWYNYLSLTFHYLDIFGR